MPGLSNLTLFTNTHSSCRDVWPMYLGQLEKHWPGHPPHVIANDTLDLFDRSEGYAKYNPADPFSQQYLQGLSAVDTEFVLTMQEDFVLYEDVDVSVLDEIVQWLAGAQNRKIKGEAFIRLIFSGMGRRPQINPIRLQCESTRDAAYPYSMQATIWRTDALRELYKTIDASTPWDAEQQGCQHISHHGAALYDGGKQRGRDHWDSLCFPYISTALVRGKWNLQEYAKELTPLLSEYGIDPELRGTTEAVDV